MQKSISFLKITAFPRKFVAKFDLSLLFYVFTQRQIKVWIMKRKLLLEFSYKVSKECRFVELLRDFTYEGKFEIR